MLTAVRAQCVQRHAALIDKLAVDESALLNAASHSRKNVKLKNYFHKSQAAILLLLFKGNTGIRAVLVYKSPDRVAGHIDRLTD